MKEIRRITVLVLVCVLALFAVGCSSEEALTEDEVFVKTIHDFGDLQVDQLTEAEDANFIVYAEGVREIVSTANRNTVVAVDTEKLCYTITNPDDELLAMEPGDVFWAAATPECPSGITVKLKSIEVTGDTAVVYSEELALEDLFVYADIFMEVPVDGGAPEGSGAEAVTEEAAPAETEAGEGSSDNAQEQPVYGDSGIDPQEDVENLPDLETTVPVNRTLEQKLSITKDDVTIKGTMGGTLHSVTVKFRFDKETWSLFTGVWCDYSVFNTIGVKFNAVKIGDEIKLPEIPVVVGGIYNVVIQPTFNYRFAGEIEGTVVTSGSWRRGFQHSGPIVGGENIKIDQQLAAPRSNTELNLFTGTLELGLEMRPALKVGLIGEVFTSFYGGVEFEGSYNSLDPANSGEDDACIHDCDVCIDGDLNALSRISCGISINLKTKKDVETILPELTLLEDSVKLKDFYIRLDPEEFGWGKCPYQRWKTTITMLDVNGTPAAGGTLRANYPDGREASTGTDQAGVGVLYLPNGDNEVKGAYMGQNSSMNIHIDGEPATGTMRLTDERQIFVVHSFEDWNGLSYVNMPATDFSEVYELIYQAYPDAVWVQNNEWYGHYGRGYEAHQEIYGLSPGDIVLTLDSTCFSGNTDYKTIYVWVGLVAYPDAGDDQMVNVPSVIWVYKNSIDLRHYHHTEMSQTTGLSFHVDNVTVHNRESYWKGLQYDHNYRITELGGDWTGREWEDAVPVFGEFCYEFEENISLYRPYIANYVTRAFPVVELLLEDEWNDHQNNLIPTEPAG